MASLNTIKNWFRTDLRPTQVQFWATWDSFWHKDEKIPVGRIDGLEDFMDLKADAEALIAHTVNIDAHRELFEEKADKSDLNGIAINVGTLAQAVGAMSETVANIKPLAIDGISVQNENAVEQFITTKALKFKGVSFDSVNKKIQIDPLVGGAIFVSSTGNDATAQLENRNRPFLTLNAAITAYWANPAIDYIEIISATAFSTSYILNDGTSLRKFDLRSQKACLVTVTTINGYHPSPSVQEAKYDLPNGSLIFSPSMSGGGFGNSLLTINANLLQFNSTFLPSDGNSGLVNINVNTLNLNSTVNGLFVGTGGPRVININAKTINFRGANSKIVKEFMILNLNFDLITHDSTFLLNTTGYTSSNITHGSITSVAPYAGNAFTYMSGGGAIINYKTGANITSNIGFNMFNVSGSLKITGNATYPNSDALVWSHNSLANVVEVSNSVITCKTFTTDRMQSKFIISNSTIIVTADKFADAEQPGSAQTFPANQFTFIGNNFIIGNTDGFNLIKPDGLWIHTNKPSVNFTKGILYTNGKIDRSKIDIVEKPLNQYYDTTDRVTVRVDEKQEIVNMVLDSSKIYLINGDITFVAGEYLIVPPTGCTVAAQGFDIGRLKKNVAGEAIVKSAVGGSGNFITNNITYESGAGKAFDLVDVSGNNAIELNDVNFQNCSELGTIKGYRQFTGTTCGIYNCNDGFTLDGTWNGFKLTNTNVSGFSATGTLIKKGATLSFKNRLYLDLNLILTAGSKLLDLVAGNFQKPKSLQIRNTQVVIDNVLDLTGEVSASLVPNISKFASVSDWRLNTGFSNSQEEPTGIDTSKLNIFENDAAASAGGIPLRGTYLESTTGYLKTRLA